MRDGDNNSISSVFILEWQASIQNIIQNANICFIDIMLITKQILSRQSYND